MALVFYSIVYMNKLSRGKPFLKLHNHIKNNPDYINGQNIAGMAAEVLPWKLLHLVLSACRP